MLLQYPISVLLVFASYPSLAQTVYWKLSPDTLTAKVERTSENDDFNFRGRFLLTIKNTSSHSISMVTANVKNQTGYTLSTDQVKLTTYGDFTAYTDFDVVLTDVKQAGTYTGEIRIKLSKGTVLVDEIPLTINIQIVDKFEVDKASEISTVNVYNSYGNFFTPSNPDLLVRYKIRNKDTDLNSVRYELVMRGLKNFRPLRSEVINQSTGPLKEEMNIRLNSIDAKADTYVGLMRVHIPGIKNAVTFEPLTINVKDGPLYVILTIIFGLVAGRFLRIYGSKEMQDFYQFQKRITDLRRQISDDELLKQLDAIERTLYLSTFDSAKVEKDLNELEARWLLSQEAVRVNLADGVGGLKSFVDGSKPVKQLIELIPNFKLPHRLSKAKETESTNERLKTIVNNVTGLNVKSFAKNWGFRTFMFFLTWILVLLLGYQINYIGKATFGEAGFFDYFTVFLWASGSTAVLKTVFSFQ